MTISASREPRRIARAEPVGSLLRSPKIGTHIDQMFADSTTALLGPIASEQPEQLAELNRLAEAVIPDLLQHQIDAGLDVITDGEVRRPGFLNSVYDAVDGLKPAPERTRAYDDSGELLGEWFGDPSVGTRLRKTSSPLAEEASYIRSLTSFPFKVTLPAPSYFLTDFVGGIESSEYETKLEFVQDIVEIEKQLVADAIAAGATYVQFDFPLYPALVASEETSPMGRLIGAQGESDEWLLARSLEVDAAVLEDLPDDVTTSLHICRGNMEGGIWSGSLAPIAEQIFNELPHQRFLIEWEDVAREGDYSSVKHVPKGRTVALGLVSTKMRELESEDEIVRRIAEAGQHLDVDQLALSPQCGFASTYHDHLVEAEDAQWRKLELIGRVADRVWGRD